MKFIIGKKVEMTQIFEEDGQVVPVTRISAGPCFVTCRKTDEKDGYSAVQIAWQERKKTNSPLKAFFKKVLNIDGGLRYIKEFRIEAGDPVLAQIAVGQKIGVDIFEVGDIVKITGRSKGKGFQGVVRRHGFSGSWSSHGHKDQLRMPGSIGAGGPGRVFKGRKMGGRMGNDQVSVANLKVIKIDSANNEIWVKGAIPGGRNSVVYVQNKGSFEIRKPAISPSAEAKTELEQKAE